MTSRKLRSTIQHEHSDLCYNNKDYEPYYECDGYLFSKLMPVSSIETLQNWTARDGDIFLLGYPGSGIHWFQEIIRQIITNNKPDSSQTTTELTHLHITQLPSQFNSSSESGSRLITTCLPPSFLPPSIINKKCKVIYLARYPKDVAVDYYQLTNQHELLPRYTTWRRFYKDFRVGKVFAGSWFDHTLFWWQRRHEQNILVVKYEDLIKNLKGVINSLKDFLGCEAKSVESHESSACGCPVHTSMENDLNIHDLALMSKGIIIYNLDWRDIFRVSHNEDFDRLYTSKMADTGLQFGSEQIIP